MRKEYCPDCKKSVVGLYYNYRDRNDIKEKFQPIRKAFYCKHCDVVLKDDEVVYKKITYEKKREE